MSANIFSMWKTFLWTLFVWLSVQAMGRTLRLVLFNHVRKLSLIRSHFVHSEENLLDILLISWFKIKEICVRKECGMSSLDLKGEKTKAILRNESNNLIPAALLFYHSFLPRSINFSKKDFCSQHTSTEMEKFIVLGNRSRTRCAISLNIVQKAVDVIFLQKAFLVYWYYFVNPWNHYMNRLASDFWDVVISKTFFSTFWFWPTPGVCNSYVGTGKMQ